MRKKKLPDPPPFDGLIHMCGMILTPEQLSHHASINMRRARNKPRAYNRPEDMTREFPTQRVRWLKGVPVPKVLT